MDTGMPQSAGIKKKKKTDYNTREECEEKRYLGGSHFAKDVPEPKCFISGSCHNGLSVRGHGLHIKLIIRG